MKKILTTIALFLSVITTASAAHYTMYAGYCSVDSNQYKLVSVVVLVDGERVIEWARDFTMSDDTAQEQLNKLVQESVDDPDNHRVMVKREVLGSCPTQT